MADDEEIETGEEVEPSDEAVAAATDEGDEEAENADTE